MSAPPVDRQDLALLILKRLAAALSTCRLYSPRHPRTHDALAGLVPLVTRYVTNHGPLVVEVTRDAFTFAFDRIERANPQVAPLLHALHGHGARELSLLPGADEAGLRELLGLLILPAGTVRGLGGLEAALRGRGVEPVAVREVTRPAGASPAGEARGAGLREAAAILRKFVAAARSIRLYGERHPMVDAAIEDLFKALGAALAAAGSVRYEIRAGSVFTGDTRLEGDAVVAGAFAADCAVRGIDSLTFSRGLTRTELAQTASLFAKDPEALVVEGGFPEALRVRQITHVR